MQKMLSHLRSQLANKGIPAPESLVATEPTVLSSALLGLVSGGEDSYCQVTFGQSFSQTCDGAGTCTGTPIDSFFQCVPTQPRDGGIVWPDDTGN